MKSATVGVFDRNMRMPELNAINNLSALNFNKRSHHGVIPSFPAFSFLCSISTGRQAVRATPFLGSRTLDRSSVQCEHALPPFYRIVDADPRLSIFKGPSVLTWFRRLLRTLVVLPGVSYNHGSGPKWA